MRTLAGLAIVAVIGLATPSAFADIALTYSATDAMGGSTSGSGTGFLSVTPVVVGNFTFQMTTNTSDPTGTGFGLGGNGTSHSAGTSQLNTTTFTLNNTSSTQDTLNISLAGAGFTVGSSAPLDAASFSVSGSSSAYTVGPLGDSTTDTSSINSTTIDSLTGTPISNGATTSYSWSPSTSSSVLLFQNTGTFSIGQSLAVTLAGGDSVTLTINTNVTPTPEPSTMAIAGLGARA